MPDTGFFKILDSVDSTNNYAMAKVRQGMATHGMAVVAKAQTEGKGQLGKTWKSIEGQSIAMSLILKTDMLRIDQQFYLSMCMALAANDFLNKYTSGQTAIKWPNDLYWRDRKAAGILIENVISSGQLQQGNWQWAVVGIGVNINQTDFDALLPNPVSLKQITGKEYDVIALAQELYHLMINNFDKLLEKNYGELHAAYLKQLYKKNEKVRLKKVNAVFETVIKSVNTQGQLITQDAFERVFNVGEIEWVLPR
jgi:BirA family transcriptional regulator, biotin operon repressor / biotin---[acetyl-CoA-carboxylase] ligase